MSERKITPVAAELIAAKKRIENEVDWCPEGQGQYGIDGDRLCAVHALNFTLGKNHSTAHRMLQEVASEMIERPLLKQDNDAIIQVNAMGHKTVMALYDHAIQRALSEGK